MNKYLLPVVIWVGIIFLMSTASFSSQNSSRFIEPMLRFILPSISLQEINFIHFLMRKAAHLTVYFILSLLLFRNFKRKSNEIRPLKWVFASLSIVIAVATIDEINQSYYSVRTGSISDVGIDIVGGLIGQIICISDKIHQCR